MSECIPFVTSEDTSILTSKLFPRATVVRVSGDRASNLVKTGYASKVWLDPGVDGMDDLDTRIRQGGSSWLEFMRGCANFQKIGDPEYQLKPDPAEVYDFTRALLDQCQQYKPLWITVPQIPFKNSSRNKINRMLAQATGRWRSSSNFSGKLILPLVFTHFLQLDGKVARNPRVEQAARCYHEAQADGFWVVDQSLADDSGSSTLRRTRLGAVISLHEELNQQIAAKIRIAGPYWALNLVLWAKGLVEHPAIGVGSGYQFFLAGGQATQPKVKAALPSLRRRVVAGPQLKTWLDDTLKKLAPTHPAHAEFNEIRRRYAALTQPGTAREQVASFYQKWADLIASAPKNGRSMALFQDLSSAYALGKFLTELNGEGPARRPESVVEPLMMSCL